MGKFETINDCSKLVYNKSLRSPARTPGVRAPMKQITSGLYVECLEWGIDIDMSLGIELANMLRLSLVDNVPVHDIADKYGYSTNIVQRRLYGHKNSAYSKLRYRMNKAVSLKL